jgi:hypothetical protein
MISVWNHFETTLLSKVSKTSKILIIWYFGKNAPLSYFFFQFTGQKDDKIEFMGKPLFGFSTYFGFLLVSISWRSPKG